MEDDEDNPGIPKAKVCLVGESGTGKTCIFNRFSKGVFDEEVISSVGAFGETKIIKCSNNKEVDLSLWDTAGQEIYRSVNKIFFRDAKIVLLVYDITSQKSFDEINNFWLNEVKQTCEDKISKFHYLHLRMYI